jgi:hypothetical protein
MHKTALSLAACLLLIAAGGAHAQSVWKWRDASGQLHISDTAPPAGTPSANILQRPAGGIAPPPAATPAPSASEAAVSDLERKKKAADKAAADKAAADKADVDQKNAAIRADNCQRAQNELSGLRAGNRYSTTNAKGEREAMDDAARAAEIKRVQDVVTQNCGAK